MLPGMEGKEEVHVPFRLSLAFSAGAEPGSPSRSLRSHGTPLVQGGFLQLWCSDSVPEAEHCCLKQVSCPLEVGQGREWVQAGGSCELALVRALQNQNCPGQ